MDGKHSILIVDDEIQIIKSLKHILNNEYFLYCTAEPEKAVEILRQNEIDVVVCDQKMPNISGLDLLRFSKKVSPNTVRILMTGYSDINIAVSSINEGKKH